MGYYANQAALELLYKFGGKIREKMQKPGNRKAEKGEIDMTKQEYVKQAVRNLNCRKDKRSEIERQLLSDIEIALGEGRQLEEILAEMGDPAALARELNENLSEAETEKQSKKHRTFVIAAAVPAVLAVLAGAACWAFPKSRDISGSRTFNADTVEQYCEAVVESFSTKDYDTLFSYFSQAMQEAVTAEMLESNQKHIGDDWGEYQGIGNVYMAEVSQRGRSYAMVQLSAAYENVSVIYTLTFDGEMQLVGFYMK